MAPVSTGAVNIMNISFLETACTQAAVLNIDPKFIFIFLYVSIW